MWSNQFTAGDVFTVPGQGPGPDADVGATPNLLSVDSRDILTVGSKAGIFKAMDRDTGETIWQLQLGRGSSLGGIMTTAATDGHLIYVNSNSWVAYGFILSNTQSPYDTSTTYALDAKTGAIVWQRQMPAPMFGAMALADGTLFHGLRWSLPRADVLNRSWARVECSSRLRSAACYNCRMTIESRALAALLIALISCGCTTQSRPNTVAANPAAASPSATSPAATAATQAPGTAAQKPTAAASAVTTEHYGAALEAAAPLELRALLATPARYAAQRVTVEGFARKVCQARGCWLELATGMQDDAEGCRVVMKGHSFFVPTQSAGRRVRVQGEADVQIIPVAQVAHMEQEGGHFAHKAQDGSAEELRIVAAGVELFSEPGS